MSLSPIETFYKDKSVFITGATGFMGKVGLFMEFSWIISVLLLGLGVTLFD